MSAIPRFVPDPAFEVGALLDDFIRQRKSRPPAARPLSRSNELPWTFRGYVHPSKTGFAWRAWTENNRICLLVAEIAKIQSRLFGTTVLDVRFIDPEGLPFPNDLWARLPDGTWLQCDLPRGMVSQGS